MYIGSRVAGSGTLDKSTMAANPATSIIGIDIKNENRADNGRSKSRVMPPAIVAPEREIPGNKAKD